MRQRIPDTPVSVDLKAAPAFDCGWRALAYAFAARAQPWRPEASLRDVHDALQLAVLCNSTFPGHVPAASLPSPSPPPLGGTILYVNATGGDDGAAGTLSAPLASIAGAVARVRAGVPPPATILLREGVHRLNATLRLQASDAGLTFGAYQGEVATVSGARALTLAWEPAPPAPRSGARVWVANVAGQGLPTDLSPGLVPALYTSPDGGATLVRATRARFPNARPELDAWPVGWAPTPLYSAPPFDTATAVLHTPFPENYPGIYQDYWWGTGGACADIGFEPPSSYWCQPNGRVGRTEFFVRAPNAIHVNASTLPHAPYASDLVASGAIVSYWHYGHWFSLHAKVAAYTPANGTIALGWGSFQGAEGSAAGGDFFVEHVLEELDAPNEFFLDARGQRLYYITNASDMAAPPPAQGFEFPLLEELIVVGGAADGSAPVANISFVGLRFTGAAPIFLAPHGTPSGGDWALARFGALRLVGTENAVIANCTFERLDGNAVFLDSWNRDAAILGCQFSWIGNTAIALWGMTADADATAGTQPWRTRVEGNMCREVGIHEKQSSCFFQATSAATLLADNIFFNGPRALVNMNDHMAGGDEVARNLLFNSCRETTDNAAFNAWDRVPYLTMALNGTPSVWPAFRVLHHNLVVNNYGADGGCFDLDDGSSRYDMHSNACVFGGYKGSNWAHDLIAHGNVYAFAVMYGNRCVGLSEQALASHANAYYNNTCILDGGPEYLSLAGFDVKNRSTWGITLGNNTVAAVRGEQFLCVDAAGLVLNMSAWAATGADPGTRVIELPTSAAIVGMLAAVVGLA